MENSLIKAERLTGKDKLDYLYHNGNVMTEFPVKVLWVYREDDDISIPIKVVFSVPKRRFKSAVKRNRIKRLMKDCYRQNKHELQKQIIINNQPIAIFIMYLGKEMPTYKSISDKIIVLLERLNEEVSE